MNFWWCCHGQPLKLLGVTKLSIQKFHVLFNTDLTCEIKILWTLKVYPVSLNFHSTIIFKKEKDHITTCLNWDYFQSFYPIHGSYSWTLGPALAACHEKGPSVAMRSPLPKYLVSLHSQRFYTLHVHTHTEGSDNVWRLTVLEQGMG